MSVKARLLRLEARQPPEPVKPWATFLWASDADNTALHQAEQSAEAKGRNIMVIRLVAPDRDARGKATTSTGAAHG